MCDVVSAIFVLNIANNLITFFLAEIDTATIDPALEREQIERLTAFRAQRPQIETDRALVALGDAAKGDANLVDAILGAVVASATVGEIADALRDVFGEYAPQRTL